MHANGEVSAIAHAPVQAWAVSKISLQHPLQPPFTFEIRRRTEKHHEIGGMIARSVLVSAAIVTAVIVMQEFDVGQRTEDEGCFLRGSATITDHDAFMVHAGWMFVISLEEADSEIQVMLAANQRIDIDDGKLHAPGDPFSSESTQQDGCNACLVSGVM